MCVKRLPKSDRVRVLINGVHAKSGGGVIHLRNILPLLAADERLEVHLFLHADQIGLFHPVDERVRVHLFTFRNGFFRLLLWEQTALPVLARVMNADVVFSLANFGPLLAPNHVLLLSNTFAVARSEWRLSKRLYWLALYLVTFLSVVTCRRSIAVSRYALDTLAPRWYRRQGGKTVVIHHGVSPLFVPDAVVPRERFLLAVSDIYVQKNLHNLVRALATLRERHPDIRLLVAGSCIDQTYYRHLVELVTHLGLTDAVTFVGRLPHEELRPLYQRCLVFVFPSTAEAFGLPLIEAMACGAPVACSNATAMPEVVGDAADQFDPGDPVAMAAVLDHLIESEDRRAELSRAALRRASEFSWQRAARETADVLCQAAGGK